MGDDLFEKLLAAIIGGTYLRGARLPAERDLVTQFGASRASVRDALRRLADWNVIAIRRGSGAVVREQREWSFEALPACLRHRGASAPDGAELIGDALALRRAIVVAIVGLAAGRIRRGDLAAARASVARAWKDRDDPAAFAVADFEIMRQVAEAAGLLPAVWLLNDLAGIYRGAIAAIDVRMPVPADYVESHQGVFDALENGHGRDAAARMQQYLEQADQCRLKALKRSE